jgi:hypothetical protein
MLQYLLCWLHNADSHRSSAELLQRSHTITLSPNQFSPMLSMTYTPPRPGSRLSVSYPLSRRPCLRFTKSTPTALPLGQLLIPSPASPPSPVSALATHTNTASYLKIGFVPSHPCERRYPPPGPASPISPVSALATHTNTTLYLGIGFVPSNPSKRRTPPSPRPNLGSFLTKARSPWSVVRHQSTPQIPCFRYSF